MVPSRLGSLCVARVRGVVDKKEARGEEIQLAVRDLEPLEEAAASSLELGDERPTAPRSELVAVGAEEEPKAGLELRVRAQREAPGLVVDVPGTRPPAPAAHADDAHAMHALLGVLLQLAPPPLLGDARRLDGRRAHLHIQHRRLGHAGRAVVEDDVRALVSAVGFGELNDAVVAADERPQAAEALVKVGALGAPGPARVVEAHALVERDFAHAAQTRLHGL
mmetsp:Transcript_8880/g.31117  ORF Transcript_8880/g.31117 Transcript_8880/m.31117 type:complete len:222 (+) Transcript_8880:263-928(+)